jgi:acetate kinase
MRRLFKQFSFPFLGARIDEAANQENDPVISAGPSRIAVHVVRIDEGRQIAREVAGLVRARPHRDGRRARTGSGRRPMNVSP